MIAFPFPFESVLGVIWLVILVEAGDLSQSSKSPIRLRFFVSTGFGCSKSCAAAVGSPFDLTSASSISVGSGCVFVFKRLDTRANSVSVSSNVSMSSHEERAVGAYRAARESSRVGTITAAVLCTAPPPSSSCKNTDCYNNRTNDRTHLRTPSKWIPNTYQSTPNVPLNINSQSLQIQSSESPYQRYLPTTLTNSPTQY